MTNRHMPVDANHHPNNRCAAPRCYEFLDAQAVANGDIFCSDECSTSRLSAGMLEASGLFDELDNDLDEDEDPDEG